MRIGCYALHGALAAGLLAAISEAGHRAVRRSANDFGPGHREDFDAVVIAGDTAKEGDIIEAYDGVPVLICRNDDTDAGVLPDWLQRAAAGPQDAEGEQLDAEVPVTGSVEPSGPVLTDVVEDVSSHVVEAKPAAAAGGGKKAAGGRK